MSWTSILVLLLWTATAFSAGFLCLDLVGRPSRRTAAWVLAFALGSGGLAYLWFLCSCLGVPLDRTLLLSSSIPFLLYGAWKVRAAHPSGFSVDPGLTRMEWLVLLFSGGCVALAAGQALWEPMLSWDARSHWTFMAKVLFYERSVSGPGFTDPRVVMAHCDYPLLIPLTEWSLFSWCGWTDDHLARLYFPLTYAALFMSVYAACRVLVGRSLSIVASGAAGTVPFLLLVRDGGAASGYADVPMAFLTACYVGQLMEWFQTGERRPLILASLVGSLMLFTRREGLVLAVISVGLLLLSRRRPLDVLLHTGLVFLIPMPWFLHSLKLPVRHDAFAHMASWEGGTLDRLLAVLRLYAGELWLHLDIWALFWWVVVACALLRVSLTREESYLLGLTGSYVLVTMVVYLTAADPPEAANVYTRSRILYHVAPAIAVFCASRWERFSIKLSQGSESSPLVEQCNS